MESMQLNYSLRQLRYFVVAAEALSFTAAAKLLHISQPSISAALSELESSFGVQLFIRHHAQGLSLTETGRDMLSKARDLLKSAEDFQTAAKELDSGLTGTISLGCLISLAPLLIPRLMSRFLETHGGISFRIREANQEDLLLDLRSGILDLALTYDLDLNNQIRFLPLLNLPPYAILPKAHRLAERKTVSLAELSHEPFVMLDIPHSREYFSSLFDSLGLRPMTYYRSSQPEVVRGMVANGLGYSILNFPLQIVETVDGQSFIVRHLRDELRPMTLGIAYLKAAKSRKVVQGFASFCAEAIGHFGYRGAPSTSHETRGNLKRSAVKYTIS